MARGLYRATGGLRFIRVTPMTISPRGATYEECAPTLTPVTDTHMPGNVADLGRILKAR